MVLIKSDKDIELLKESGRILALILRELKDRAREGVTLAALDKHARIRAKEMKAYPTFLGYQPEGATKPYPAAICASLNDVVVHGVPNEYALKSGDLLSVDMGITYEGMITDAAFTVPIGKVGPKAKQLMAATRRALEEAIKIAKPGRTLGDIGWVVERQAGRDGFKVLRGLTGHGVGYELHEDPVIFNFGEKGSGMKLKEGMVLAIEPMLSLSTNDIVQNDDESYSSVDGSLTAHFEHTIVITSKGNEVLTR